MLWTLDVLPLDAGLREESVSAAALEVAPGLSEAPCVVFPRREVGRTFSLFVCMIPAVSCLCAGCDVFCGWAQTSGVLDWGRFTS